MCSIQYTLALLLLLILPITIIAVDYTPSEQGLGGIRFEGGCTEFEFADINNDGNVDILSIGDHGSPRVNTNQHGIMVFFGNSQGEWTVHMNGDFGYGGIAIGDVNNDGNWDVGQANHHPYTNDDFGNQMIEVVLGDGTGENWEPYDDGLAEPRGNDDWYGMFGTDFGDVDNDGLLDIGSNSFGSGTGLHLYSNNGDGTWEDIYYHFGRNNSDKHFVFGEINGDGNLDFVASLQNRSIHFGDGEGNFEMAPLNGLPTFGILGIMGIDLEDIDGDGDDDLSFINADYGIEVFSWDGENNRWIEQSDNLPNAADYYKHTDLCDMNMDGIVDLVTAGVGGIQVWLQDPDGDDRWNLDYEVQYENFMGPQALRAGGDIDHNGKPDIVTLVEISTGFMTSRNFIHVLRETSEAEELAIFPVEPDGNERYAANSAGFIDWLCELPGDIAVDEIEIDLHYSIRGADGPWVELVSGFTPGGRFQWQRPNVNSENCYVRFALRYQDQIVIEINEEPFSILGGEEVPMMVVEPLILEFEELEPNEPDVRQITIRNTGFANLTVEPVEFDVGEEFLLDNENEQIIVEPDAEVQLSIVFDAQEPGLYFDQLLIASDGGNAEVRLIGRTFGVEGPVVEAESDTLHFGRVRVNRGDVMELVLNNTGDVPATVNIPESGDNPFNWEAFVNEEIEPEGSMSLEVRFDPAGYGEVISSIPVSYQTDEFVVTLTGFGFGQPRLIASPDTIAFGEVLANDVVNAEVTIRNNGDEIAVVDIPASEEDVFSWDVVADRELAPGGSFVLPVSFSPDEDGDFATVLRAQYQAGEVGIILYGSGIIGPFVVLSTDTLDFGNVLVDSRTRRDLIVRNNGNQSAAVEIGSPVGRAFTSDNSGDLELEPGDSIIVRVTFVPWFEMPYEGTIAISYDREDFEIYLTGAAWDELSALHGSERIYTYGIKSLLPNPANDEVLIEYYIDKSVEFTLDVYDLNGRHMQSVYSGTRNAGYYKQTVDIGDLTSGTYLMILKQAGRVDIRKVIHLR